MERHGDKLLFDDLDRFRYGGLGKKQWLPVKVAPELFQEVTDEKERVGHQIQRIVTGNAPEIKAGERPSVQDSLIKDFRRIQAFQCDLADVAGDVIIDMDVPAAI